MIEHKEVVPCSGQRGAIGFVIIRVQDIQGTAFVPIDASQCS